MKMLWTDQKSIFLNGVCVNTCSFVFFFLMYVYNSYSFLIKNPMLWPSN